MKNIKKKIGFKGNCNVEINYKNNVYSILNTPIFVIVKRNCNFFCRGIFDK
jgi:hypothetical protein